MKTTVLAALLAGLISVPAMAGQAKDSPGELFDYNGSVVMAQYRYGTISYMKIKPSLAGLVDQGMAAFAGDIKRRGRAEGTAYTFRKGCPFAMYRVSGVYDPSIPGYVMTGKAPVRAKNGCDVVGYTSDSPNARLVFVDMAARDGGRARSVPAAKPLSAEEEAIYNEESDPNWMKGYNNQGQ